MIPVLLIAKSFVRQNRWLLVVLVVWPLLWGALDWAPHRMASESDVTELLQQEVFYGIVVVTFLTSSAIYNDKRSRRIVGVLSKGISRGQYLTGLALGGVSFAAFYFVATAASLLLVLGNSGSTFTVPLLMVVRGCLASFWMASLALLLSTFLFPFVAATLTGVVALLPAVFWKRTVLIAPVPALLHDIQIRSADCSLLTVAIVLAESAAFIALAATAFADRDVTVSVE
jgi:hypothetical protein